MAENWDKDLLIDEPTVNIREAEKVGESGVESFFCDDLECKKEQESLKKICGLKTSEDFVEEIIDTIVSDINQINQKIKNLNKIKNQKVKWLEALAMQLNFDFAWEGSFLILVKNDEGEYRKYNTDDSKSFDNENNNFIDNTFMGIYSGPNISKGFGKENRDF